MNDDRFNLHGDTITITQATSSDLEIVLDILEEAAHYARTISKLAIRFMPNFSLTDGVPASSKNVLDETRMNNEISRS
jgi:hypothetical protein